MVDEIIKVSLTALASVVALFFLTKLIGRKQMSELSMFDYINGITIGSIAAEMATELESPHRPLAAMIIYALAVTGISILDNKSIKLRRLLTGVPLVLFQDGKLYSKSLATCKISVDDFLAQCRLNGYYNLASLQTAMLEPNGRMSFLPRADTRPLTPGDMSLSPRQELLPVNVIVDGTVMKDNLKSIGHDELWLLEQLSKQNIPAASGVTLATVDSMDEMSVYTKI